MKQLPFLRFTLGALFALATVAVTIPAKADEGPTNTGPLTKSEQQFITTVRADLMQRYPRAADAEKAGYVRYTGVDDTGAISYANRQWKSDPTHPSQLWYDVGGNLMGADFSVPRPHGEARPVLWGIDPGRWYEFNGHVHFVLKDPASGKLLYDQWIWNDDFTAAGGSLTNPSAATVVQAGKAAAPGDVQTIFEFPTQWDLVVWFRPHSTGLLHW